MSASHRSKSSTIWKPFVPFFTRKNIEAKPTNLWRYSALLPLPGDYQGTVPAGFTPLVHARRPRQTAEHKKSVPEKRRGLFPYAFF